MRTKAKLVVEAEVDAAAVTIEAPVNYGEEDIPADFPGRDGDLWRATIDVDTGRIAGWPADGAGGHASMHMKVTDGGTYRCLDRAGQELLAVVENYVPPWIPGEDGDYLVLSIAADGAVEGWDRFRRRLADALAGGGR